MSKPVLHVQFSSNASTYGDPGDEQDLAAWKLEADGLMFEYLESLGYEVKEENDGSESTCWLDDGDIANPHALLEKAWEYACAHGGEGAP